MTESEWLCSDDPERMLAWITCAGPSGDGERDMQRWEQRPSHRKLRAVCHALLAPLGGEPGDYPNLPADWLRGWIGAGSAGPSPAWPEERVIVANLLREVLGNPWRPAALEWAWFGASEPPAGRDTWKLTAGYRKPGLVRPRWASHNAPWQAAWSIAQRCYDERDFAALPVLADALMDAGCESEDLLRHLRGQERCWECSLLGAEASGWCAVCGQHTDEVCWMPLRGPHVRGCWVLDLILGKDGVP